MPHHHSPIVNYSKPHRPEFDRGLEGIQFIPLTAHGHAEGGKVNIGTRIDEFYTTQSISIAGSGGLNTFWKTQAIARL